jgi:hypothetical protein
VGGVGIYEGTAIMMFFKGTVWPGGSAWDWYHWKALQKDINSYMFLIFNFWSWIFDKSSKFWAAPCKKASNPPACSDHGLHVLKPRSYSPNRAPKMRERHQLFFGLRLASIIPKPKSK